MTSGQEAVVCQAAPSPVPAKQVVSPRGPGRSTLPAIPRHVNWAWGPPPWLGHWRENLVPFVKCPSILCRPCTFHVGAGSLRGTPAAS